MGEMVKIDMEKGEVTVDDGSGPVVYPMDTPEAFRWVSRAWLRCGWDNKHVYSFTWMGVPIIQLPEDLIRIQEVLYSVKPDVIIECGVAHGGALLFYASLCKAMGNGRVIGVDIDIRSHNRKAIEAHPLFPSITLIEGDSIAPEIVREVESLVKPDDTVMVMLDSCHEKDHVLNELRAYSRMVSLGSYIVAMDGIMEGLVGAPRTEEDWSWNNPKRAAIEFVSENPDYVIDDPKFIFNEGNVTEPVTYWPCGYIKRVR
jgi:cephalosporin hydroxylase